MKAAFEAHSASRGLFSDLLSRVQTPRLWYLRLFLKPPRYLPPLSRTGDRQSVSLACRRGRRSPTSPRSRPPGNGKLSSLSNPLILAGEGYFLCRAPDFLSVKNENQSTFQVRIVFIPRPYNFLFSCLSCRGQSARLRGTSSVSARTRRHGAGCTVACRPWTSLAVSLRCCFLLDDGRVRNFPDGIPHTNLHHILNAGVREKARASRET